MPYDGVGDARRKIRIKTAKGDKSGRDSRYISFQKDTT